MAEGTAGGILLTVLIFLPLMGAVVAGILPAASTRALRAVATAFAAAPVVLVGVLIATYRYGAGGLQFQARVPWIPAWHIQYFVAVDGLSLAMLGLSAVVCLLAVVASYGIEVRVKEYFVWFLIMEAGILGVFSAEDLILFIFFFDIVLVPMYFLIAIWGGRAASMRP